MTTQKNLTYTNSPGPILELLTVHSSEEILRVGRELLLEYGRFVASQPGVAGFCYGSLEQEARNLPHTYVDSGGGAMLASIAEKRAGFVAWRGLFAGSSHETAWELKRLWVRPEARGHGVGRILIEAVIERALADGRDELLLDTAPDAMAGALRLYRKMGFEDCPPYGGIATPGILYLRKGLR